jgi:PucR family transcriptional regulator, purine catabolism regulatory protein
VSAQALATKPRSFLVAGRPERFGRADHHVVNSAAALLTLGLARSAEQREAMRGLRTGLMLLLLGGGEPHAAVDASDALPDPPLRVLCGSGDAAAREELAEQLEGSLDLVLAEIDNQLVVVVAERSFQRDAFERLAAQAGARIGVSESAGYDAVADAHGQATQAAEIAAQRNVPCLAFTEVATAGLLRLVPKRQATAFSRSLLGPLISHDEHNRGDLAGSLREWLRHHGQWDPAAARLGVHRHTLRNRMAKAARLLDADLDDPGVRAELWLALCALRPSR